MIKNINKTKLIDILIVLYTVFIWFSPPIPEICSILIVGLWFVQIKKIKMDAILFLSTIWICYTFINGIYAIKILGLDVGQQINAIFKSIKLMLFIPFGYFIKERHREIPKYLFCACIGIFIGLILNQDWSRWRLMLIGLRSGANKWWYLIMGLYSSTAMMISFFLKDIYNKNRTIYTLLIFFILIFFHFTIVSQSRTIWFAVLTTICILSLLKIFIRYKSGRTFKRDVNKKNILLLLCLVVIVILSSKTIIQRVSSPDTPIFGTRSISRINPSSSFGMRLEAWKFAIEKIKQRPILGWGIGTNLTKDLNPKNHLVRQLSHVHSTYLDLMAKTGIVGFVIFISLNIILYLKFFQQGMRCTIQQEIFFILIAYIVLNSIFCTTTTRILHYDWKVYYTFFNAIIYSFILRNT